jgi:hypothetical protein
MFDADSWSRTEPHLQGLPGAAAMCERIRQGAAPWPVIGGAMSYCTWFPAAEFRTLLASGDFDVRWPLTFAAWYWGSSGASVDQACADFLTATGLWDQALEVLAEYTDGEWLPHWRTRFEQCRRGRPEKNKK